MHKITSLILCRLTEVKMGINGKDVGKYGRMNSKKCKNLPIAKTPQYANYKIAKCNKPFPPCICFDCTEKSRLFSALFFNSAFETKCRTGTTIASRINTEETNDKT